MNKRHLITELEVRNAITDGSLKIRVEGEPIITPLAASMINENNIKIIQVGSSNNFSSKDSYSDRFGCPDEPLDITNRDTNFLLRCLTMMLKVRGFEEAMGILFREKHLTGFLHLSIGQEAISVGACSALQAEDYLTLTHRGHGQMVARGSDINRMAAELLGKESGYCRGKGGSLHVADFQNGILGANGIVGAGIVIAVGAAMSAKIRKSNQIALTFFGDGATNQGAFHEGMNYAAAQKLPVIFLCENNQYAVSTAASQACAASAISKRGLGYDMPSVQIDGQNVLLVHDTVKSAAEKARSNGGPTLIECITYRYRGHGDGETTDLRPGPEKALWARRDPIVRLEQALIAEQLAAQTQIDEIHRNVVREIGEAVRFAEESPYPNAREVISDVLGGGLSHA
ncbi:MAG: thiamine pyrophosphate-dependent enzyme [Anaerolineaceae bacterium]|nr:thiamine pyrophosphate-dependent enzyme [Anaerolineaceae bacterium]